MQQSAGPASGAGGHDDGLGERDRQILDFESRPHPYAAPKEQLIREELGMSATRYYQLLDALIDRREALEEAPILVKRLRRIRDGGEGDRTISGMTAARPRKAR